MRRGSARRREEVYFHDRPQSAGVGIGETAMGGDAGVVHEDIEAAEFTAGGVEGLAAGGGVGHVAGDNHGALAQLFDLLGNFGEPIGTPSEEHDVRAVTRELERHAHGRCRSKRR